MKQSKSLMMLIKIRDLLKTVDYRYIKWDSLVAEMNEAIETDSKRPERKSKAKVESKAKPLVRSKKRTPRNRTAFDPIGRWVERNT